MSASMGPDLHLYHVKGFAKAARGAPKKGLTRRAQCNVRTHAHVLTAQDWESVCNAFCSGYGYVDFILYRPHSALT
jgi:hypothetical protein